MELKNNEKQIFCIKHLMDHVSFLLKYYISKSCWLNSGWGWNGCFRRLFGQYLLVRLNFPKSYPTLLPFFKRQKKDRFSELCVKLESTTWTEKITEQKKHGSLMVNFTSPISFHEQNQNWGSGSMKKTHTALVKTNHW